jgi:phosphatidate cytidylyltransferase
MMKERVLSGVIAGSLFIAMLIVGHYWYAGLIVLLAILAHFEFMKLNGISAKSAISFASLIGMLLLVLPLQKLVGHHINLELLIWLLLFGLLFITVATKNRSTLDHAAVAFIGTFYIGLGFHYMIDTRLTHGLFWTIFIFISIWVSDSGAYFTGRAFGKHKLWPTISPKKTIEGAIGGTLLTILTALVFVHYAPVHVSMIRAIVIGIVISISGMFGDLIESAYKRVRDIKDSGNLLPGHGGILDRTDSWIIVFPLLALLDLLP